MRGGATMRVYKLKADLLKKIQQAVVTIEKITVTKL